MNASVEVLEGRVIEAIWGNQGEESVHEGCSGILADRWPNVRFKCQPSHPGDAPKTRIPQPSESGESRSHLLLCGPGNSNI